MNKEVQDFTELAKNILHSILKKAETRSDFNFITLDFTSPVILNILAYNLLDAYNEGYDAAILAQTKRGFKND